MFSSKTAYDVSVFFDGKFQVASDALPSNLGG
jgi:hypothetical protein